MGEYFANKVRCKNCEHFESIDKSVGFCHLNEPAYIFVVHPNQQMPCFVERKEKRND